MKQGRWTFVVAAAGLKPFNQALWPQLGRVVDREGYRLVVLTPSEDLRRQVLALPNTACLLLTGVPFSWPTWMYMGVHSAKADYYGFLHDDIALPEDLFWPERFEEILKERNVGLVVPQIKGTSHNEAQALPVAPPVPYYHLTEFICNAALAVEGYKFALCGGFREALEHYDWWGIDLQHQFSENGWSSVVASEVQFGHIGGATYGKLGSKERAIQGTENAILYCQANKIYPEFDSRPAEVRIARPVGKSLCVLTDGKLSIGRAGVDEIAVVDFSGDRRVWESLRTMGFPWRWQPPLHGIRPEAQVVSLSGGVKVELQDLRDAERRVVGRRMRAGTDYRLPDHLERLHLGILKHFGLGDVLMMTPALHHFHQRFPDVPVKLTIAWQAAADLLRHNPSLSAVHVLERGQVIGRDMIDLFAGGAEGTIAKAYLTLGLDPADDPGREMHYYLTREEFDAAQRTLEEAGYPGGWLVGVQQHGLWQTKNWRWTANLVTDLLEAGATVVMFGTDPARYAPLEAHPRLIRLEGKTSVREAFALLALLDAYLGFESGLTCGAVALRAPSVILCGSHNPRGLIADVATPNVTCLRVRGWKQCQEAYNKSCRHDEGLYGQRCPLRGPEEFGADCHDDITPEMAFCELHAMPRWPYPLKDRYAAHYTVTAR